MAVKEIKANYHSYLNEIKAELDPVITKMRTQAGQPWRGKAWLGPIRAFSGYLKHLKALKAIQWSALPIIGPIAVSLAAGTYGQLPIWFCAAGGLLLAGVIYYLYVRVFEGKMATISHPEFHVEAFKAKRPTEYAVWAQFVHKNDFTFEGLYDLVNSIFAQPSSDPSGMAYVVAYSQSQHDHLQRTIHDLQTKNEELLHDIHDLERDLTEADNSIGYLVELLKKINQNLYRYTNDTLDFTDLDMVTGFSLYRREGDYLAAKLDKGTTGRHRRLSLETDTQFAAVMAALDKEEKAHYNTPYQGRHLLAFRMTMLEGETWVWCFHFDHDDERALSLLMDNDMIESRQIRRMIHAFCLIIQKRELSLKEGHQNGTAS